ncbi:hypothetical protein [Streptosporangium longisporum]|uniref:Uncharacterized protein n=1 Tax=Streptosporangium longisporum TaxID=46187 RepID=A0ABP6KZD0_9ACTN
MSTPSTPETPAQKSRVWTPQMGPGTYDFDKGEFTPAAPAPALIEYAATNERREGAPETFVIYVAGVAVGSATFTYLGAGEWYLCMRDTSGEPTSGTRGDMWSAPMPILRERVHIEHDVPLTDIEVHVPDIEV